MMSSGDSQQSQALTKPTFTEVQASALVESVFGFKVSKIRPLPSYDDQNFHVHISRTEDITDDTVEYVLKISNTESSKTPDLIEVQNHVIMFLRAAGFPTASVCRTKGDNTISLMSIDSGSEIKSYLVRMLSYLPGRPIAEIAISHQQLYEIGRLAAQLDKTLEEFHHPKLNLLHRENFIWNLKNVPLLENYMGALSQSRNREIVEQVIQLFKEEVMTKLSHFREYRIPLCCPYWNQAVKLLSSSNNPAPCNQAAGTISMHTTLSTFIYRPLRSRTLVMSTPDSRYLSFCLSVP
ncbi:hydroxylysine kinase isoform X2 [Meriones unguiculatus]|uniref:hydroxylysine kinase isoform X2 n=1 Tax=Meriones unguiculatus TaxID=10047 RepID=UPI000B4E8E07|nr:hydroxylysine kinase isoform X2 [Meriones unguiculatus]